MIDLDLFPLRRSRDTQLMDLSSLLYVCLLQGYGLRLRKGLLFSMNYETYVPQLFDGEKWRTLKGWPTQVVHSDGITIPRSILC